MCSGHGQAHAQLGVVPDLAATPAGRPLLEQAVGAVAGADQDGIVDASEGVVDGLDGQWGRQGRGSLCEVGARAKLRVVAAERGELVVIEGHVRGRAGRQDQQLLALADLVRTERADVDPHGLRRRRHTACGRRSVDAVEPDDVQGIFARRVAALRDRWGTVAARGIERGQLVAPLPVSNSRAVVRRQVALTDHGRQLAATHQRAPG